MDTPTKKILHFHVPEHVMRMSPERIKAPFEYIKDKFSSDYEIIFSPFTLEADGMVNITISADSDIEDIVRKLTEFKDHV